MMVANDLVEVSLRDGEEEINLRRPNILAPGQMPQVTVGGNPVMSAPVPLPVAGSTAPARDQPSTVRADGEDESELVEIASPMVGTFYTASDPESPAFVDVGSAVQVGMVVCILEAMKVFNEIKSEVAGTIERILVKNADPVEFGQPLFMVRPV